MSEPLAYRMRPSTISEVLGQKHLIGEGSIINRMVETNHLQSMILYGPPGIGKTSIAKAIAGSTNISFRTLNAAMHNKKDMEIVVEEAKMSRKLILILDEVHRLDKGKQDYLLPFLENGMITLIGATTENPYHAINAAIRSRCHIFELHPLQSEDIEVGIRRATIDEKNGLGGYHAILEEEAIQHFSSACNGDIRSAYNALELAIISTKENDNGERIISLRIAEECLQKKRFSHDKNGDSHYNTISAFQKSIRGSDTNAALHYLARLIEARDLQSICRRLLVIAYEDIGLAYPDAGPHTLSAIQSAERLGFPEARIPLAQAVIELCLSPKSNSAITAIDSAIHDIRHEFIGSIPSHIQDVHFSGAKDLGRRENYLYPHDYPNGWIRQQYLPNSLKNKKYYTPKNTGKFERAIGEIYKNLQ